MSRIAVALYYLTRVWAFLSRRFWQWVIDAYLRRNCKSYGSMSVYGHGRFANVSGLSVGQNIHVNFGPNWVCDGGLTIGDNVHISSNCTIYTRNHNTRGRAPVVGIGRAGESSACPCRRGRACRPSLRRG